MKYIVLGRIMLGLAIACWAIVTGLAIEKVLADGVASWTLLLAMPIFVAAIALLFHLGVEDARSGRIVRPFIALGLAVLTGIVTLPNSIGSTGSAKDTIVAEAEASNRSLAFSETMLAAAMKDLEDAKKGVARECEGAPEKIVGTAWPKCQWWRRQVEAHTLAVETYGSGLAEAPVEKTALSGEKRIAWAISGLGALLPSGYAFSVSEAQMQMALPMFAPIAGEFLCAFFGFMWLEFRKLARREEEDALAKPEAQPEVARAEPQREPTIVEKPVVSEPEAAPPPPKSRKKPTKREQRKAKAQNWVRDYTQKHGHPPAFRVVKGRFHLSDATASRWRKQALEAA